MPIYDYHCDHCGHTFSAVQSYIDATLDRCPSCGKQPRKLMATPAIVFKGGGWYKTDSRPIRKDGPTDGSKESGDTAAKEPAAAKTETAASGTPKAETSAPADPKATPKATPKGEAASS